MKKQLEKHALDVEALIDRCSCASGMSANMSHQFRADAAWEHESCCRQPFRGQSDRWIALNEGICEGNANPDLRNWEVERLILSAYAIHPLSFYEDRIFELC